MTTRRGFIKQCLAMAVAPAVVGSSVLMPVRKIITPGELFTGEIGRCQGVIILGTRFGDISAAAVRAWSLSLYEQTARDRVIASLIPQDPIVNFLLGRAK